MNKEQIVLEISNKVNEINLLINEANKLKGEDSIIVRIVPHPHMLSKIYGISDKLLCRIVSTERNLIKEESM